MSLLFFSFSIDINNDFPQAIDKEMGDSFRNVLTEADLPGGLRRTEPVAK